MAYVRSTPRHILRLAWITGLSLIFSVSMWACAPMLMADVAFTKAHCSCFNSTSTAECCDRAILRSHKSGTILTGQLFGGFRYPEYGHIDLRQTPRPNQKAFPSTDYRHVMVIRNYVDAIVSGYLYHKDGYECWKTPFGQLREHKVNEWASALQFHQQHPEWPSPSPDNRSMCSYLVDESEEDGMRALMDLALSRWFVGNVPYWEKVHYASGLDRSLFVCYEDLVSKQSATVQKIHEFLFPSENRIMSRKNDLNLPLMHADQEVRANSDVRQRLTRLIDDLNLQQMQKAHGTTASSELRQRLARLVERYDAEYFNGTIAHANSVFGCGVGHGRTGGSVR